MKLRGAISGFGEVAARAHLPGWLTRPEVSLSAIHDPIAARRHLAFSLTSLKGARVYDNLELMLNGEAPDFVDIASPPAFHAEAIRMALEADAHVLVEKPLCLDLKTFENLAGLAAARDKVLMCVHNWEFAPAYARAHELISAGRLGELRYLAFDRLRMAPAGAGARVPAVEGGQWRRAAQSGGGILIDHGWHVFYLICWLMRGAMDEDAAVSARLLMPPDADAEDVADLRIRFPGGQMATVHLSWRAPVRRTSARIYGERALLEIEGDRLVLTERGGKCEDLSVSDAADDSYHAAWFAKMAECFVHAIGEGYRSRIARENQFEARMALKLTLAARESSHRDGAEIGLRNFTG